MLKQLINEIRLIGEARDPERTSNIIQCRVNNGDLYNIKENLYHADNISLHDIGFSIAAVLRYGNILNPIYVVVTDYNYNNLSIMTKKFIMLHEEGHIINNHYCIFGYRELSNEYIADEYAVRRLGYKIAVKALEELKPYTGIAGLLELNKRIRNIKRL